MLRGRRVAILVVRKSHNQCRQASRSICIGNDKNEFKRGGNSNFISSLLGLFFQVL